MIEFGYTAHGLSIASTVLKTNINLDFYVNILTFNCAFVMIKEI
jgi:hypothetical protein